MTTSRAADAQPARPPPRRSDRARRARGSPRCAAPETCASPDRCACSRAAAARAARSPPAVRSSSIGASRARLDDRAGDPPRETLLAEREDHVGQLAFASTRATRSAAVSPPLRSMRMSSGSSRWKLKPRPGASNCIDDTPRSASVPSTQVDCRPIEHARRVAGSRREPAPRDRSTAPAFHARSASASRSRSRPMSRVAPASSSARAWPPSPTVQSTNRPPRSGRRMLRALRPS